MYLKPLGDRVIIRQAEAETKTKSGILLASTSQEKPSRGTVIAVGDGKVDSNGNLVKPHVKEGDTVIYSKYGGTEVTIDEDEVIILREDDIFAIVEA